MPLSRRYSPEWAEGDSGSIGMDFSAIIPPGVGIINGWVAVLTNTATPADAHTDFTGPIASGQTVFTGTVSGRAIYTTLKGGVPGKDYQFLWTAFDTDGNEWNRTALLLCAPTS